MPPTNFLPLLSVSHRRSCFPVISSSKIAPGSSVHASRKVFCFVSAKPLWPQPGVLFNTVVVLPSHFDSVFETHPNVVKVAVNVQWTFRSKDIAHDCDFIGTHSGCSQYCAHGTRNGDFVNVAPLQLGK